jgi:hypothetical protein
MVKTWEEAYRLTGLSPDINGEDMALWFGPAAVSLSMIIGQIGVMGLRFSYRNVYSKMKG